MFLPPSARTHVALLALGLLVAGCPSGGGGGSPSNRAPVPADDVATTAEETAVAVDVLVNDVEPDEDPLTVSAATDGANGTVTLLAGGELEYLPDSEFSGTDTFSYTVTDGELTADATVTVTVSAIGDSPVALDDEYSIAEDGTLIVDAAGGVLGNDADVDSQAITAVLDTDVQDGTLVLAADGSFTYTPGANFAGTDSFTYHATDGLQTSGTVTVTLDVSPVNDAPVADADAYMTGEDTALVIAAGSGVLANDTDIEASALTAVVATMPTNGTITLGADGAFTYTPDPDFAGTDAFRYFANDGATDSAAPAVVTITVNAVNDAPVAENDDVATDEDTPLVLTAATLVANDADIEGQLLTVTAVTGAMNGEVSLVDGTITFTPDANFAGTAGFDYTVSDSSDDDMGHVIVTVDPVDDRPVATAGAESTDEDVPLQILLSGTDVEGSTLSFAIASGPATGSLGAIVPQTATTALVTYTPGANSTADDSFTFTVDDGSQTSFAALVTIDVVPVNDAPLAIDDGDSTDEDTPLVRAASAYTANDQDVEGDALDIVAVQNGVNGSADLDAGTITFTPDFGFSGAASFEYVLSDGGAVSDVGRVDVTVLPVPVCNDGVIESPEQCDDGGLADGDGCSSTCAVEPGWSCAGEPSVCDPICNDGLPVGGEECDDGDAFETNGCTTQCKRGPVCEVADLPGGDAFATDPATGTCYAAFDAEATTFAAAQTACVDIGGHLVTITGAAEQTLVHAIQLDGIPWIGAQDDANDVDTVFDWVTDEPWGFDAFLAGEPDDDAGFGGNGECLAMVDAGGLWGDTNCDFVGFTTGRICEISAAACGDDAPTADLQADPLSGQAPLVVNFSGTGSSDPNEACGDSIVSYDWSISGGEGTLSGPNPTHVFATPGTYQVVLTVTDESGGTDTDSTLIVVLE